MAVTVITLRDNCEIPFISPRSTAPVFAGSAVRDGAGRQDAHQLDGWTVRSFAMVMPPSQYVMASGNA